MRGNRAQFFVFGILAFVLVLIMVLVITDMAAKVAVKTNQNTWEAEMEQIAIAATNDLVLNPDGGMLVDTGGQPELNDHLLDRSKVDSFKNSADELKTKWATGRCNVAVGVYEPDGTPVKENQTIEKGKFGKLTYRRLVVILDDKGNREVGYIDFEIAC